LFAKTVLPCPESKGQLISVNSPKGRELVVIVPDSTPAPREIRVLPSWAKLVIYGIGRAIRLTLNLTSEATTIKVELNGDAVIVNMNYSPERAAEILAVKPICLTSCRALPSNNTKVYQRDISTRRRLMPDPA
jgi:hypothetical protein